VDDAATIVTPKQRPQDRNHAEFARRGAGSLPVDHALFLNFPKTTAAISTQIGAALKSRRAPGVDQGNCGDPIRWNPILPGTARARQVETGCIKRRKESIAGWFEA
jgi:hypothetical protein